MTDKVFKSFESGRLNEYMRDKLLDVVSKGVTDQLIDELVEDAQYASDAGVSNDDDYNVYFFIMRFADDILNDTFGLNVEPHEKKDLCHYIMSNRNDNYKLDNLTDYRLLTHKWLCDRLSKKAYPNISGKEDRQPKDDIDKWIGTLKDVYSTIHSGDADRHDAVEYFTANWDADEKQRFRNWMRYYEDGTTEKYNVKTAKFIKEAFGSPVIPEAWTNREDRAEDKLYMSTRQEKRDQTKREKELEKARGFKSKMRARLRSFKRLLEKYNDVLPKQNLDDIYDEMYKLEKNVTKLDVYASIQDCMVRSANRMSKFGFPEGAEFLQKVAAEPEVINALPAPESKEPDLPPQGMQMNNVQTVINRLEALSKALKTRDMIRELASIDILLNEMGMASYFPELTDAQAKLIESFGYASNKVEQIVAKLRGSGTGKEPAQPKPPEMPVAKPPIAPPPPKVEEPIETGELLNKPIGKVKKELPTE